MFQAECEKLEGKAELELEKLELEQKMEFKKKECSLNWKG